MRAHKFSYKRIGYFILWISFMSWWVIPLYGISYAIGYAYESISLGFFNGRRDITQD